MNSSLLKPPSRSAIPNTLDFLGTVESLGVRGNLLPQTDREDRVRVLLHTKLLS